MPERPNLTSIPGGKADREAQIVELAEAAKQVMRTTLEDAMKDSDQVLLIAVKDGQVSVIANLYPITPIEFIGTLEAAKFERSIVPYVMQSPE